MKLFKLSKHNMHLVILVVRIRTVVVRPSLTSRSTRSPLFQGISRISAYYFIIYPMQFCIKITVVFGSPYFLILNLATLSLTRRRTWNIDSSNNKDLPRSIHLWSHLAVLNDHHDHHHNFQGSAWVGMAAPRTAERETIVFPREWWPLLTPTTIWDWVNLTRQKFQTISSLYLISSSHLIRKLV